MLVSVFCDSNVVRSILVAKILKKEARRRNKNIKILTAGIRNHKDSSLIYKLLKIPCYAFTNSVHSDHLSMADYCIVMDQRRARAINQKYNFPKEKIKCLDIKDNYYLHYLFPPFKKKFDEEAYKKLSPFFDLFFPKSSDASV